MKHRWKRLLSGMLAAVMLLTMLPATALAAVSETANMDQAQREAILAELQSITGSEQEAESLYRRMQALGLFDADGNWTTEKLQINGEEYTLAEARSFVDTLTDDTFVTVGETTITAADLRTMIEIEEEIARIRDTYFNGEEWTDEEKENLASLEQALNNGDVIVRSSIPPIVGSNKISHAARVSVDTSTLSFENGKGSQQIQFNLDGAIEGQEVSFDVRAVDGSAKSSVNFEFAEQTVTMTANADGTATAEVPVSILNDTCNNNTSSYKNHVDGAKTFYILYDNIKNALFDNEKVSGAQAISITGFDETVLTSDYSTEMVAADSTSWVPSDQQYKQTFNINNQELLKAANSDLYNCSLSVSGTTIQRFKDSFKSGGGWSDYIYIGWNGQNVYDAGYAGKSFNRQWSEFTGSPDSLNDANTLTLGYKGQLNNLDPYDYTYPRDIGTDMEVTLRITNEAMPEASSVIIPDGTFSSGQAVPIVVTFSEPVKADGIELTINEQKISPAEDSGTVSNVLTFPYIVKDTGEGTALDSTSITNISISGVKDAAGDAMTGSLPTAEGKATLESGLMENAIESISISPEVVSPAADQITVTADIVDGYEETFLQNQNQYQVFASIDGTNKTKLDLAGENGSEYFTGDLQIGQNTGGNDQSYTVELFVGSDAVSAPLYFGKAVQFTQSAPAFITEADLMVQTDNFPAAGQPVYTDEDREMTVSVGFADGKTENDFTWGSTALGNAQDGSEDNYTWGVQIKGVDETGKETWTDAIDGSIASVDMKRIDQNENMSGTIALGGSAGTFRVSLTAKNGGVEGKAVTVYSQAVTVGVGKNPMLTIPASLQTINIKGGDSATLRWTSNLTERNYYKLLDQGKTEEEARAEQFPFTIEVYERKDHNYVYTPEDGCELPPSDLNDSSKWEKVQGPITVNSSMNAPASSYSIAGLDAVSVKGGYSYAIKLSAKFNETGDNITEYPSYALVSVVSRPAVVTLQRPDTLYYTESSGAGGVDLNWSLQNFDDVNNGTFELIVTNNDSGVSTTSTKTSATGGSYHLKFDALSSGRMRESYTVEVRVRNTPESTWSYDSVVLYYYDDDAFQIYVNGT